MPRCIGWCIKKYMVSLEKNDNDLFPSECSTLYINFIWYIITYVIFLFYILYFVLYFILYTLYLYYTYYTLRIILYYNNVIPMYNIQSPVHNWDKLSCLQSGYRCLKILYFEIRSYSMMQKSENNSVLFFAIFLKEVSQLRSKLCIIM